MYTDILKESIGTYLNRITLNLFCTLLILIINKQKLIFGDCAYAHPHFDYSYVIIKQYLLTKNLLT